ncbi:MAG: hypothetical protein K2K05_08805 [Muribaculaceae bacterium]|nr:hypothetical protein [Muribaculaceae bacterium]
MARNTDSTTHSTATVAAVPEALLKHSEIDSGKLIFDPDCRILSNKAKKPYFNNQTGVFDCYV